MKFKVGDIIEIIREDWTFRYRYKGILGKIIDVRAYHSFHPTHYVIKFTCYKIPHIYYISDIERVCEIYKIKKNLTAYDR